MRKNNSGDRERAEVWMHVLTESYQTLIVFADETIAQKSKAREEGGCSGAKIGCNIHCTGM